MYRSDPAFVEGIFREKHPQGDLDNHQLHDKHPLHSCQETANELIQNEVVSFPHEKKHRHFAMLAGKILPGNFVVVVV
jgi:hypothetical protein